MQLHIVSENFNISAVLALKSGDLLLTNILSNLSNNYQMRIELKKYIYIKQTVVLIIGYFGNPSVFHFTALKLLYFIPYDLQKGWDRRLGNTKLTSCCQKCLYSSVFLAFPFQKVADLITNTSVRVKKVTAFCFCPVSFIEQA